MIGVLRVETQLSAYDLCISYCKLLIARRDYFAGSGVIKFKKAARSQPCSIPGQLHLEFLKVRIVTSQRWKLLVDRIEYQTTEGEGYQMTC